MLTSMFDTHCHLNFKSFQKTLHTVLSEAKKTGVEHIVVPGTDLASSTKAVALAVKYEGLYAAVGIHPHHVYEKFEKSGEEDGKNELREIEKLLRNPKVVAIGEVGMDRHVYEKTKYAHYAVDKGFIQAQKEMFQAQVRLAVAHHLSLIIHNREAKADLLPALEKVWDASLEGKAVFHCCEPDEDLLRFAKAHKMFIGIDGDITYRKDKQEFVKQVPLEMLVVETDSPFLLPEPLRTQKKYPNTPSTIPLITAFTAGILRIEEKRLRELTEENGKRLFGLK